LNKIDSTKTTKHPFVRERLREGVIILCACLALFLLLAFVTYHHNDPGWSTTGNNDFVANAGGRFGAWVSDVFLYLFGYMAYFLPFIIAGVAWLLLRHRHDEKAPEFSKTLLMLRLLGFCIALLAGAGLFTLFFPGFHAGIPLTSGGVLGETVTPELTRAFNTIGTTLILLSLLLLGLTLLFGISWAALLQTTSRQLLSTLQGVWAWHRQRRHEKAERPDLSATTPSPSQPQFLPPEKQQRLPTKPKKQKIKKSKITVDLSNDSGSALPTLDLLDNPEKQQYTGYSAQEIEALSQQVEARLLEFGVEAKVVGSYSGPVVTRFELQLAPGVKVSKITNLSKDLARSLSKISVRIVDVIPGKSVIGLEIPNAHRQIVRLKEVLQSDVCTEAKSFLTIALGKDVSGHPVVANVEKMPHLLVAGTTGSGKSVSINAMILSLLLRAGPEQVRMIMIDPKMLELSVYEGIPHLLTPVVIDMKQAANALRWCVAEMDRRYRLMASLSVRNLEGYNQKIRRAIQEKDPLPDPFFPEGTKDVPTLEPLPQIIVFIDELADLMIVVGKKVEELIARIAQKARAAGIHMIVSTQRPSVDVITGLIKANIPARIAFQVSSRIDSRTILDQQGAEQLLGCGDMLYMPLGTNVPMRVHGAYVADSEVLRVVAAWKKRGEPNYVEEVIQGNDNDSNNPDGLLNGDNPEADPLYDQAIRIVTETRRASISLVQRRLKIGYNRSANLLEAMERAGVVSTMGSNGQREVLAPPPVKD
jgi:DNA segregation ATPase FtsK/SpoIIIE, S-DNA-T family